MNPKIEIDKFYLNDGGYSEGNKRWDMQIIIDASKGLPIYDLQLSAVDLAVRPWCNNNLLDFLYHINRINNANLDYPIIQGPGGYIIDGWHRVSKAILNGETTIKAVRLNVMPMYSELKPDTK